MTVSERLAEIRRRVEAATKGPWGVTIYGSGQANVDMPRDRSFHFGTVYGARGISSGSSGGPIHGVSGHELDGLTEAEYTRQRYDDAAFIASARTDVPLLLAVAEAAVSMMAGYDRYTGDRTEFVGALYPEAGVLRDALSALAQGGA